MTTLAESGLSSGNRKSPKRLEALLIGAPGTRKTVIAHSMPRTRTLDFDNGLQSVEWAILAGKINKRLEDIVYETILPKSAGEEGMAEMLNRACDIVDAWIEEEDKGPDFEWDTLIVDSASFMTDAAIGLALTENARVGISEALKNAHKGMTKDARERGLYVVPMRIQDWGSASNLFMKAVRQWKAIGKNLIITAHEYERTTDEGMILSIQPNVIGQLREKLPAAFDEVWYTVLKATTKEVMVRLRVHPDAKREAKTRLGCLDLEEDADFLAIRKKVAGFYKVPEEMLWAAYHGSAGREKAEQELADEAVAI